MGRKNAMGLAMMSFIAGLVACGPDLASQLRQSLVGTWDVVETSGGWTGGTVAFDPGHWTITFGRDGSVHELYENQPAQSGTFVIDTLGLQTFLLVLEGDDLRLFLDAPFEASVQDDTLVLASTWTDSFNYRLVAAPARE